MPLCCVSHRVTVARQEWHPWKNSKVKTTADLNRAALRYSVGQQTCSKAHLVNRVIINILQPLCGIGSQLLGEEQKLKVAVTVST